MLPGPKKHTNYTSRGLPTSFSDDRGSEAEMPPVSTGAIFTLWNSVGPPAMIFPRAGLHTSSCYGTSRPPESKRLVSQGSTREEMGDYFILLGTAGNWLPHVWLHTIVRMATITQPSISARQ